MNIWIIGSTGRTMGQSAPYPAILIQSVTFQEATGQQIRPGCLMIQ